MAAMGERYMFVNRINNEEERTKIQELYRVMTLEQFLGMLLSHTNTLLHTDCWEDPYEKLIRKSTIEWQEGSYINANTLNWSRWYGQCWSSIKESDGIWRAFTHNKEVRCVKIKTTREKLEKCCTTLTDANIDFYLDAVNYVVESQEQYNVGLNSWFAHYLNDNKPMTEEEIQRIAELSLLMTKRIAFEHESEVRLLAYNKNEASEDVALSYHVDVFDLIDEIEFDPWAPKHAIGTYMELMRLLQIKCEVKFSELYKEVNAEEKGYKFVMRTKKAK